MRPVRGDELCETTVVGARHGALTVGKAGTFSVMSPLSTMDVVSVDGAANEVANEVVNCAVDSDEPMLRRELSMVGVVTQVSRRERRCLGEKLVRPGKLLPRSECLACTKRLCRTKRRARVGKIGDDLRDHRANKQPQTAEGTQGEHRAARAGRATACEPRRA